MAVGKREKGTLRFVGVGISKLEQPFLLGFPVFLIYFSINADAQSRFMNVATKKVISTLIFRVLHHFANGSVICYQTTANWREPEEAS